MMRPPVVWESPRESRSLAAALRDGEVHVWFVLEEEFGGRLPHWGHMLDTQESERAARCRDTASKDRFVIARGLLRVLLARYAGVEPNRIGLACLKEGKPFVESPAHAKNVCFNLSHSGGALLYAFAWGRDVGVDIQQVRDASNALAIARRFFTDEEVAALSALPSDRLREAFFACWTRKEAYAKARGDGVLSSFNPLAMGIGPLDVSTVVLDDSSGQDARRWTIMDLAPYPGYAAAVAVEGERYPVRCWRLDDITF